MTLGLTERTVTLREDLRDLQKELTENQAVLGALQQRLTDLEEGRKSGPQAHITQLAQPVPQTDIRFNRAAEAWGAVSLSLILRGHYVRTVVGIASILAVISATLLVFHFWLWIIVVLLAGLSVFLMVQKLRELQS